MRSTTELKQPDWSGKRGSNPRPPAWKASALSTELFPHSCWRDFRGLLCTLCSTLLPRFPTLAFRLIRHLSRSRFVGIPPKSTAKLGRFIVLAKLFCVFFCFCPYFYCFFHRAGSFRLPILHLYPFFCATTMRGRQLVMFTADVCLCGCGLLRPRMGVLIDFE